MKKISVLAVSLSLGMAILSAPAFSAQQSEYRTEFKVPEYINPSISDCIPVKIKITATDGKPYNGKVKINTGGSVTILDARANYNSIDLDVVEGEVSIRTEIVNHRIDSFSIWVSKSPASLNEVIGGCEIPVHYVASYEFLPEQSKLSVPADGKTSATVLIRIKDQYGSPVKGVLLRASHKVQQTKEWPPQQRIDAVTDSKGIAKFVFPPTKISQYVSTNIVAPSRKNPDRVILSTSGIRFLYKHNEKPKMVSLKNAIDRINVATYTWDKTNRTVTIKGVGSFGADVVFKEGTQFVWDGSMICGLEAPIQRNGNSLMAPEFAGWQHWVY